MKKRYNRWWKSKPFSKFFLVMKITTFFLIISTLNVLADTSYAQSTRLSLKMNDVAVKEVLESIEQKSDFFFLYSNKLIDVNRKVDIFAENESISDILKELFFKTNVKFVVMDKQIVLSLDMSNGEKKDNVRIHGKVISSEDNLGLPGVNIVEKGTNNGTVTDLEGNFTLLLSSPDAVLVVSFVGYETVEISPKGMEELNVSLNIKKEELEEVVVVGYGTTRKIDLTGSVSSVRTKDLSATAQTSVGQMLQGRAAGLNLTSVSAQPGGRLNINIRGGTNPLYVIDGVPILNNKASEPGIDATYLGFSGGVDRDPLNSINPSDIESIDILKDASAAAIYGSAAADGVILITTKKGKSGKVNVDYRGSYTIQTPKDYIDLLDASGFMEQHNRFEYDQYLLSSKSVPYGTQTATKPTLLFSDAEIASAGKGTDWLDLLMRNGAIQEHNISLSGGTDYTRVFASMNYFSNTALLENSTFDRYSGRINFDQQIGSHVKVTTNATFSQINSNNASTGANQGGPEKYNMLQTAYVYSPTFSIYDSLGRYSQTFDPKITNPAAFLIINDYIRTNRFMVNPNIEIKITNGLKANVVGGIDRTTNNRSFYLPRTVRNVQVPSGMAQLMTSRVDNYSSEAYLTYSKQFTSSNLTVVGGAGYYRTVSDGFGLTAIDFFTDAFSYYNVGVAADKDQALMSSYNNQTTKISQYFRVNYSLFDKYLLSFLGRNDAFSEFAPNKKYAFFPGFSAGWRINKENFMADMTQISDLKLRLGYGTSGNEGYLGTNSLKLYKTGYKFLIGSTIYPGVALAQEANPYFSWETDATANIGLDLGFLANRITATIDVFSKTKRDLLDYNQLPFNNAVGRKAANIGTQISQGWEFSLNTKNLVGKFLWATDITLSSYSLLWKERNPQVALASWIKIDDPVYAIYGWKTNGIIKSNTDTVGYVPLMGQRPLLGNIKYIDNNKDGKLDEKDVVMLADGTPKLNFGFNNTFRFMSFDLNIYMYGMLGRKNPNGYRNFLNPTGIADKIYPYNTIADIKNVWSSDNPNGIYPGLSESSNPYNGANPVSNVAPYNSIANDFWLVDGSFARIKNITFGYTLPDKLVRKLTIRTARVYIDFQNVYVLTKYKGIDPEVSDVNPYPQALSTSFGLNATF